MIVRPLRICPCKESTDPDFFATNQRCGYCMGRRYSRSRKWSAIVMPDCLPYDKVASELWRKTTAVSLAKSHNLDSASPNCKPVASAEIASANKSTLVIHRIVDTRGGFRGHVSTKLPRRYILRGITCPAVCPSICPSICPS